MPFFPNISYFLIPGIFVPHIFFLTKYRKQKKIFENRIFSSTRVLVKYFFSSLTRNVTQCGFICKIKKKYFLSSTFSFSFSCLFTSSLTTGDPVKKIEINSIQIQQKWEDEHMGNFRQVYPGSQCEKYDRSKRIIIS